MRSVPYDPSTIEKTFTVLKTFLKHYYKRRKEINIILDDTFMDEEFKKGKKKANEANPLLLNEFIELSKMKFSSNVFEKTKDRFVLQCSTGLRFSDMDKITPDKIDKGRIKINPTKTEETKDDNTIYIDLNKYSRAILKKYHNDTTSLKISNQKYNDNLEDMFEELKWKKRTSHNGRDTFISICIQKKVPVEVILTWTGQSSYSVMRRYIKVPDDHKKSEMNRAFR
jgi:integrase